MKTNGAPAIKAAKKDSQAYDGEPFVIPKFHLVRCCDCGKTHLIRLKAHGRRFIMTVWTDRRRTAARRRNKRFAHLRKVDWPK